VKINGTGQVGTSGGVSRKKNTSGTDSFGALLEPETSALSAMSSGMAAAPLASVGGLFALQETPDATQGRSKGMARAEDLLKQLEDLRRGLLVGAIPVSGLQSLAYTIRQQRAQTDDPRLNDILGEIELRAEVELAKLGY
jgi:hypothetical protein